MDAMLLGQNTRKTGNNAVKMSQAFQDIAQFECFTDLKLLEYAGNRICIPGLSLRAGGRGFSPATKRVVPGYFYWKIEEK